MARKKNIAVYLPQIYSEYISELRKSIEAAVKGKGYRLIFFTCFGDNSSMDVDEIVNQRYDEGERAIFRVVNPEHIDGVLLLYDSFARSQWNEIREMVRNRCQCPVINFRTPLNIDVPYNIYVDDRGVFEKMIQHFIHHHQCTKIDLVTGPEDNVHSLNRLNIFKKVLEENGIPFEEKRVHYGNFWKNCGEDIVREIMDSGLELPEAVVCANDYMAMSVIDAFRERDISVPGQVLVSGYDDIEESRYSHPALTTVKQPVEQMGRKAIEVLEAVWDGKEPEKDIYLPEEIVLRQSCGCDNGSEDFSMTYSSVLNDKLDQTAYLEAAATSMVTMMSNAVDKEECFECLKKYALRDTGFKSFALCLADHWEKQLPLPDIGYGSSKCMVTMVLGIHKGEILETERFPVRHLMPEAFVDDMDSVYVVPIHYLQYYMGYAIVQLDYDIPNGMNIKSWFMHLDNALENIRMRYRLSQLVAELEDLYVRDTMTGLYNRRGLDKYADIFHRHCVNEKKNYMIMEVDMDGLKQVNDQYGHEEGDNCIIMIANGLIYAARDGEICIRSGGDEFLVLGRDYTQEKLDAFIRSFEQFIESANESMGKPYKCGASIGYFMGVPDGVKTVENYMKVADDQMYANKKMRKAKSHPGVEIR